MIRGGLSNLVVTGQQCCLPCVERLILCANGVTANGRRGLFMTAAIGMVLARPGSWRAVEDNSRAPTPGLLCWIGLGSLARQRVLRKENGPSGGSMNYRLFHTRRHILSFVVPAMQGLALLCSLFLEPSRAFAQATVSSTASVTNVPRAGANLSNEVYYTAAISANLFQNPGFEFPQFGIAIPVSSASSTSFKNRITPTGDPAGFWDNAACTVRVGTCSDGSNNFCWSNTNSPSTGGCTSGTCNAGTTFKLSNFSSSSGTDTFTCSGSCPTLHAPAASSLSRADNADVVGCRVTIQNPSSWSNLGNMGNWTGPWTPTNPSDVFVTTVKAYQGNSSLEINAAGGTQSITYLWDNVTTAAPSICISHPRDICTVNSDCPSGDTCNIGHNQPYASHPIVGRGWRFSFYAYDPTSGGATSCTATLSRWGGHTSLNHTFSLTANSTWTRYFYGFTGADTSGQSSSLNFRLSCSGGTVYIDNIFLGKLADDTGAFRNEIVQDLRAMNVGSIRWGGWASPFSGNVVSARQVLSSDYIGGIPVGPTETSRVQTTGAFTFADVVELAHAISFTTSPWLTIPIAWSDVDYITFGNQVCSWESTYSFPNIWVECNNENWNGWANDNWKVNQSYTPAYGMACARAFNLISKTCSDSQIRYLINNQTGNNGVLAAAQATARFPNSAQYGASDHLYTQGPINSSNSLSTVISDFFRYNDSFITSSLGANAYKDPATLCNGKGTYNPFCLQQLQNYEWSVQPDRASGGGTGGNTIASQLGAGWGGAGIGMQTLILALTYPPANQALSTTNAWQLVQDSFNKVKEFGLTPANWGTNRDFAPTWPWLRPEALAIELYNSAVQGDYHACIGAPSGVHCAAFYHAGKSQPQVALSNANSSPTPVTITFPSGTRPPTLGKTVLYTRGMADNNEASNSVYIGSLPGGVSRSGQQVSFAAPAFSAVALLAVTHSDIYPHAGANTGHRQHRIHSYPHQHTSGNQLGEESY
jgi:hypothetical protein